MRVCNPDLLIGELGTKRALCFDAIVVCNNFPTLHHKAWNDALKDAVAIVQVETEFTGAKRAEVLDCAWHLLLE